MIYIVLDSGVGGLAFIEEVSKTTNDTFIPVIDRDFFPYGLKTFDELNNRLHFLLANIPENIDGVIIACNTLSCVYYQTSNVFPVTIYDMVTPTVRYLRQFKYENITVVATSFTTNSGVYDILNGLVYVKGDRLINAIQNNTDINIELLFLLKNLIPTKLILWGCTHFIKIKKILKEIFTGELIFQDEFFKGRVIDVITKQEKAT